MTADDARRGHLTRGEAGPAVWGFRRWARREKVAVSLCTYECRRVPGPLQSEAYARAVFDNSVPPLSDEQVEAQVAARLERQNMPRERPDVPFGFIVEEHVFRRRLGGRDVTRTLLDHVLELPAPRGATFQIMPLGAGGVGAVRPARGARPSRTGQPRCRRRTGRLRRR